MSLRASGLVFVAFFVRFLGKSDVSLCVSRKTHAEESGLEMNNSVAQPPNSFQNQQKLFFLLRFLYNSALAHFKRIVSAVLHLCAARENLIKWTSCEGKSALLFVQTQTSGDANKIKLFW